jgi:hypothetical protein
VGRDAVRLGAVIASLRPDLEAALGAGGLPLGMGEAAQDASQLLRRSETAVFACCGSSRGRTRKVVVVTGQRLLAVGHELGQLESWSIDVGAITAVSVSIRGDRATVTIDTRAGCFALRVGRRDGRRLAAALRAGR